MPFVAEVLRRAMMQQGNLRTWRKTALSGKVASRSRRVSTQPVHHVSRPPDSSRVSLCTSFPVQDEGKILRAFDTSSRSQGQACCHFLRQADRQGSETANLRKHSLAVGGVRGTPTRTTRRNVGSLEKESWNSRESLGRRPSLSMSRRRADDNEGTVRSCSVSSPEPPLSSERGKRQLHLARDGDPRTAKLLSSSPSPPPLRPQLQSFNPNALLLHKEASTNCAPW